IMIDSNAKLRSIQMPFCSDEQAKEFVAFLRLFLEVAFVLPERIKEQQQ
ncbi:hypothetical protein HEN31_028060, partial [Escherichia coli]|nr:hypothetical protein [Escherichia coli]